MKKEVGDRIEDTSLKKKKENTFSSNIERKGCGQGGAASFLVHLLCFRNRKI